MLLAKSQVSSVIEPIAPGLVVGERYQVLERLGKGGMGVVFAARDVMLGRKVALKFVRLERADDESYSKRLRHEAQVAGSLLHENVAQILDYGMDRGRSYVVLEFIDGNTLDKLLESCGPLSVERAADLVSQVCRGLLTAHQAGVVHRDIKTSNLMVAVRADGRELVKILDFGIARFEGVSDSPHETTTGLAGTPHYMAPEVARGENGGDVLTDTYSAGVVLFELLTGRKPHDGSSKNAVLYSVTTRRPRSVLDFAPHLPEALAGIVDRTIEPEREKRTRSINALLHELEPFLAQSSSSIRLRTLVTPSETRRNSGRGSVLVALTIAVAMAGGYWLGRHPADIAVPSASTINRSRAGSGDCIARLRPDAEDNTPSLPFTQSVPKSTDQNVRGPWVST